MEERRLVVSDASPLIGLASAGAFDLLQALFVRITVTAAVHGEVMAGGKLPGARELDAAIRDGWIEVVPASPDARFAALGVGEASTLALAARHPGACLVLMDEPIGRSHAKAHGLTVTGVAGVLLAAKRASPVQSVRPFFDRLERSEFRLSQRLVHAILEEAEEGGTRVDRPVLG